MAITTKLSITYNTNSGTTTTHSYKYANADVTSALVQALVTATLTNASLFYIQPVSAKSAKLVETEETEITLS